MKKKIVVIGGGGHAKVVIDLLQALGIYDIVGILDPAKKKGDTLLDVDILGGESMLGALRKKGIVSLAIGIGGVRDTVLRKSKFIEFIKMGFKIPTLVHPFSHVSPFAKLSIGVQVIAGSVIQPCAVIGENTLINTRCVVGHDCSIGSHVHVAPTAVLGGGVTIGDDAFVGSGAKIIQGVCVGRGACIAAGAVVIRDVAPETLVKGVPAR